MKRILIVYGYATTANSLAEALAERFNEKLTVCNSISDLMADLAEDSESPLAVLVGFQFPSGVRGDEIVEHLRTKHPNVLERVLRISVDLKGKGTHDRFKRPIVSMDPSVLIDAINALPSV